MIAVQNIVRRYISHISSDNKKPGTRVWTASDASLKMLEDVQTLLGQVKECEMAMSCANWVVKELPTGELYLL